MITVLHVLEAVRSGTVRHVIDVVRHTPDVDHHVALPLHHGVVLAAGARAEEGAPGVLEDAGATLHVIDMRRNPLHPANGAAVMALRRLISRDRPEIVHGHSSVGGVLGRTAAWTMPVARVYTPNGLAAGRLATTVERALGRRTDKIIAVSASEADHFFALGLAPRARIAIIPNGIPVEVDPEPGIDLRAKLGLGPDVALVGCVARVAAQKAPDMFVRACARVAETRPDVHFLLIGLGPQQDLVDAEVRAGRLEGRFHQIEYVPGAAAVMGQFDVFVLTSRFEGGPYTAMEAMRAGVPVVLSNVVGNRDAVTNGVSGLLVPFGDVEATARAILRVLTDSRLAGSLAEAGRERLRTEFDVRVMGERLARLYQEVTADGRRT